MKYSFKEVKEMFESRGYELLSSEDEYTSVNSKLRYICPIHGEKVISFAHLKEGKGCRECGLIKNGKSRQLSEDECRKICKEKGLIFKRTYIKNKKRYIDLLCPNHLDRGVQSVEIHNLKRNKGCKYCARNVMFTQEEFEEKIDKISDGKIKVIGTYRGMSKKVKCLCKDHGIEFDMLARNLLHGSTGCKVCSAEKQRNIDRFERDFIEKVYAQNPHIIVLSKYKGCSSKVSCYCKKHKRYFSKEARALYERQSGCGECYKETMRKIQGLSGLDFIKRLNKVHPSLIMVDEYINWTTPITFYCIDHDCYFKCTPSNILNRTSCCDKTVRWTKEIEIGNIIQNLGYQYVYQKTFKDCKDKNVLPFDYYLPDINVCIEYQGEQHCRPVNFNGRGKESSLKKLEYTQKHDSIKREYCERNNIGLIEIPYWEYDNAEKYLIDELNKYHQDPATTTPM